MSEQAIREVGLKVTSPRLKILEVLQQPLQQHMSAEDVHHQLQQAGESISLATVYRVLTQFELVGLIQRQQFEGGHAVFEVDTGDHHDHMVCTECGRVTEFLDSTIEKRQDTVAAEHNFNITHHCMILYGECADCR